MVNDPAEHLDPERFRQDRLRTEPPCPQHRVSGQAGDDNDAQVLSGLRVVLDPSENVLAGDAIHVEVEEHVVVGAGFEGSDRCGSVEGAVRGVAQVVDHALEEDAGVVIVVDDKKPE